MAVAASQTSSKEDSLWWEEDFNNDVFNEHPVNVTVPLGSQADFWCSTGNEFDCTNMTWMYSVSSDERHPLAVLETCRNAAGREDADLKRFSVSCEDGRYGLHISNVTYMDSGRYACGPLNPELGEYSRMAMLTVTSPPPECSYFPERVAINETVRLICRVPLDADEDFVRLTWYSEQTRFKRSLPRVKRGLSFSEDYLLQEKDNYGQFICVVGPDENDGPNCTLVPLKIPMTITLQLDSSESLCISNATVNMTFECYAVAVPPVTKYRWVVMTSNSSTDEWRIAERDNFLTMNSGKTLVISQEEMTGNNFSVSCTASNDIDMTRTSELVTIIPCSSGSLVIGTDQCDNLSPTTTMSSINSNLNTDWVIVGGIVISVVIVIILVVSLFYALIVRSRRSNTATYGARYRYGVAYRAKADTDDLWHVRGKRFFET